jgi:hypothetical protein
MSTYRVEFGPAWPVPPITVDFTDHNAAAREIARHAIPHLTPVLTAKGRPELADCFFVTSRDLTGGYFMWVDLEAGEGCPFLSRPADAHSVNAALGRPTTGSHPNTAA